MAFYIIGALLIAATLGLLIRPLLRGRGAGDEPATSDVDIYKDQLRELDNDIARGVLSEEEAEASRIEISRRLLAADAAAQRKGAKRAAPLSGGISVAIAVVGALAIVGVYGLIGSPGMPDRPLESRQAELNRPSQAEAEARAAPDLVAALREPEDDEAALLAQLLEVLEDRPNDVSGLRHLANLQASFGAFAKARAAQARVVDLSGESADAADLTSLAEYMIFAAGGYVSPEAEDVLARALTLNVGNQRARYYSGVAMAQNRKPDIAMRLWSGLLAEGPRDAPWYEAVRAQTWALAEETGLPLPPAALRGPDAETVDAARDLTAEDRAAMIENMVEGLAERLATEGGNPGEWAQLIASLGVLGQTDRAQAIYNEAKSTFANDAAALDAIGAAARQAGLDP